MVHLIPKVRVIATVILVGAAAAGVAIASVKRTPSPKGAEVYFIAPQDGATVTSPVTVRFGTNLPMSTRSLMPWRSIWSAVNALIATGTS